MKRKEKELYRSLVILGCNLRELIEINGHSSIYNKEGGLFDYLSERIIYWLEERYLNMVNSYSGEKIYKLVNEIMNFIIRKGLLARDTRGLKVGDAVDYYSDLHLINTNEKEYGDKYFGISFRENGSFGSLPLYDDYSEESDS